MFLCVKKRNRAFIYFVFLSTSKLSNFIENTEGSFSPIVLHISNIFKLHFSDHFEKTPAQQNRRRGQTCRETYPNACGF